MWGVSTDTRWGCSAAWVTAAASNDSITKIFLIIICFWVIVHLYILIVFADILIFFTYIQMVFTYIQIVFTDIQIVFTDILKGMARALIMSATRAAIGAGRRDLTFYKVSQRLVHGKRKGRLFSLLP